MTNEERADQEREVTKWLLDTLSSRRSDLPARIAAGALMRASVLLAAELSGPDKAPEAARAALEIALADLAATNAITTARKPK